jgi:hypothetical protein
LSVALQHAEFCTELVVNLYSGWICCSPSLSTPALLGALIFPPY